jgi:bacteriocin-like protein
MKNLFRTVDQDLSIVSMETEQGQELTDEELKHVVGGNGVTIGVSQTRTSDGKVSTTISATATITF